MKLLRILTGTHAGAQLRLAPGAHRIGTDDDADIRVTDWRGADLWLDVTHAGIVSARAAELVLLVDFVPMQFDGTILCIGEEGVPWPSDYDLLSTLLAKPATAQRAILQRRYAAIAAGICCVGAVIVTVSVLSTSQTSRAALPRSTVEHAQRVGTALAAAHIDGLAASAAGDSVVVTGMLASPADAAAVRQVLDQLGIADVTRRYDVAPDVARSIEDSLGVPGAQVRHAGGGRFVVKGVAGSRAQLEASVAHVRADLDPNVKDVLIEASEISSGAEPVNTTAYSALIAADGIQYAQTPDGVKHIYAVEPAPAEAGASRPQAQAARPAG